MPFELWVGPPASGKTTRALARARAAAASGKRVWWVGLTHQRAWAYRRATGDGPILGLEFLTIQQVAYRLLADAGQLQPLVMGTERLVLVGEALAEIAGEPPGPGEAQLHAFGISEAKRFRVSPAKLPVEDATSERLRDVFAAYERLKGARWDYDDFRNEALRLAQGGAPEIEADLIVADGWREIGPGDLQLLRELGRRVEVLLTLPEAPPTASADGVLQAAGGPAIVTYRAANPVAEARWVLRSLKRDVAEGADPLDLAVVAPVHDIPALLTLASEYGVPVADETPYALADTAPGRRLVDLLMLAETPTPSALRAIPELEPLARAALAAGVAGRDAVGALADDTGLADDWRAAQERLRPGGMAWARDLVALALERSEHDAAPHPIDSGAFVELALRRAKEASVLGTGETFVAWWEALLREADLTPKPTGGVAILDVVHVSGRRYPKVYLMRAVAGAYDPGAAEDHFFPEDVRVSWEEAFEDPAGGRLPQRLRGTAESFFRDLRTRGDTTIVTYAQADRDGPLAPEGRLVGASDALPPVPAGSRLELVGGTGYQAPRSMGTLVAPSVERLQRYAECGFRTWAEDVVRGAADTGDAVPGHVDARFSETSRRPAWELLRAELVGRERWSAAELEELAEVFPNAAIWLREHTATLTELRYGVRLAAPEGAPWADLHAARRDGATATLYRFVEPGSVASPVQAEGVLGGRWNEMWAAGRLLQGYGGRIERVDVVVWPVFGEPVDAFEGGITYPWRRVLRAAEAVDDAYARFQRGDIAPKPGFICRACTVADICREGLR